MTLLETLSAGKIPDYFIAAAKTEGVSVEKLKDLVLSGRAIVCKNRLRDTSPLAIGEGLKTKVNANIGTSRDCQDVEIELLKLDAALKAGADTVMDLSTGGDLKAIRARILQNCPAPLGTVPIYQTIADATGVGGHGMFDVTSDDFLKAVENHAREGVDFVTVHCGITLEGLNRVRSSPRLMGVVSRGGSFTVAWMMKHGLENPLFARYDELLEICREYEVVISLGDGFRPGAGCDATDGVQLHELIILGELTKRAWKAGVQVMVEGPGHVPMNQIAANVTLQKRLCHGAPFYVLGPLVTDVAPGYDHITSAIGGAIAAAAGADILCYVTPAEHLGLPNVDDVKEGVIASRIAGHAADIAKGVPGAAEWDINMSKARANLDWERQINLSIDPVKARALRERAMPANEEVCTMCGEFCAVKVFREGCKNDVGSGG